MIKNIPKSLLKIRQNLEASVSIETAVSMLYRAGVFEFLRERAAPSVIDDGESVNKSATTAHFSAGFNACLTELLNFREIYLTVDPHSPVRANIDFGAIEQAIKNGDLTEEEAHAIRTGKQFDPSSQISSTRADFQTFQRKATEYNARHEASKPTLPTGNAGK